MTLSPPRKIGLGFAAGAALALIAVALATRGPVLPPTQDLSTELARAFARAQDGALALSPAGQVGRVVLEADGVAAQSAPSFRPRHIDAQGAAAVTLLKRRGVLVRYRGDVEGAFAVISLRGARGDLSQDSGTLELANRRFTTFDRTPPGQPGLRGVGQLASGHLVFVVGPQRFEVLAHLAVMIPPG